MVGGTPVPDESRPPTLEDLMRQVSFGDEAAFERLYEQLSAPVFGLVRRVVRDRAQAEEVTQEVMVEVWRTASRFDPARGSALSYVLTMAHRRAVDRVRSAQASTGREERVARMSEDIAYDQVSEAVTTRIEGERVRRCLGGLTELQRQAVTLAYYGGYSYPEVAGLLKVPLGTIKTRMRDGLVRLRDCMGVER
ncbi:sigma-70 family RNA polymerase sigma factor [Thermopolyspora sp. NPDC052614]|uniref:sigma-70 family RNA polymerase sigma factor n=1 Tax=Thermopolyspora sp. NPDC052614 TaxID=3155682 RepID=UPI00342E7553